MNQKNRPVRRMDERKLDIIYALILALCFALVIYISSTHYKTPDQTISYTVQPGDTIWGIAEMYCPSSHTGNVALKIERMNEIEGYIQPGQVLEVPCEPMVMESRK